jgi:hypothetical protein
MTGIAQSGRKSDPQVAQRNEPNLGQKEAALERKSEAKLADMGRRTKDSARRGEEKSSPDSSTKMRR